MLVSAASQAWPAFVLVAGLLLVGRLAHDENLFDYAAWWLARLPGGPRVLFSASAVLTALVTALLNLDTAVVFLTPVLLGVARARGIDERPFLYATVFMANASSLFLPGSNLTYLLVLAREPVAGATFAARLLPAALAASVVTAALALLLFGGRLVGGERGAPERPASPGPLAVVAVVLTAALVVVLASPALPVLGLALAVTGVRAARRDRRARDLVRDASPLALAALFSVSVALGVLGRAWGAPGALLAGADRWATAAIGALTSIAVNNLPAAVLLSAHAPVHPRALLIGLNLGPNLAVTGSLSSYLWFRAARLAEARPSARAFSRYGLVLAPTAVAAALLAQNAFGAGAL